jgi:hypothetical protein
MESGAAAKQQQNLDARSVALLNRLASRASPNGLLSGMGKPGSPAPPPSVGLPTNAVRGSGMLDTLPIKHSIPLRPASAAVSRSGQSPMGVQGRLLSGSIGRLGEAPFTGGRAGAGSAGNTVNSFVNLGGLNHVPIASAFHQEPLLHMHGEQERERSDNGDASTGTRLAGPPMTRTLYETGAGASMIISRSSEEKLANPDRLVLDRRKLTGCPILEGEERLRLLNYQNNFISKLENLHNLPNLIFLDLYNNQIKTMENLDQVREALREALPPMFGCSSDDDVCARMASICKRHASCVHACTHACMHACRFRFCACVHARQERVLWSTHTYMHACMHAYIYACMHACIHAYMCTHIYTCIHAFMHTCIHTCMFLLCVWSS